MLLEAGSIINRDEELRMDSPERRDIISSGVAAAVKNSVMLDGPSSVRSDRAVTAPSRDRPEVETIRIIIDGPRSTPSN